MPLHSVVFTLYPLIKIFHWLPESREHGILSPASIHTLSPFSPSDSLTASPDLCTYKRLDLIFSIKPELHN